jgi:ankyrin repeat protein
VSLSANADKRPDVDVSPAWSAVLRDNVEPRYVDAMAAGDWKDMFLAACEGDVDLVRHHLANGVDVDFAHPEFQSTALVACILAGQEHMAHFLLDQGADPLLKSELEDQTPVQAARVAGLTNVEARLRSLGATEPHPPIGEERRARRWWLPRPR